MLDVGADLGRDVDDARLQLLLESFRQLRRERADIRLTLAWARSRSNGFTAQNWVESEGLTEVVRLFPYVGQCRFFPLKKADCALWIDANTPVSDFQVDAMRKALERARAPVALFVTAMDPARPEGNSALMRQWLRHLRAAGYRIHVLYYRLQAPADEGLRLDYPCDVLHEVSVESASVGSNRNGLNVHVDDWCGVEAVEAAGKLAARTAYDVAIVNYAFLSSVFEALPVYTRKILLTHDRFADRNRRMLADGMAESGWVSLTREGEALACLRSDVVVAVQDDEAEYFGELTDRTREVRLVGPVPRARRGARPEPTDKLRVGYLGSSNWVNETNLVVFMGAWADRPVLNRRAKLILAGGVCETLSRFDPDSLAERIGAGILGRREHLAEVFRAFDIFVNPERGGTGIKIKTLEALAHGVPVLTTAAGAVGIGSTSRFHSAPDLAALADLVAEVAADPALLDDVRRDSSAVWAAYTERHENALSELLGKPRYGVPPARRGLPAAIRTADEAPVVPDYVRRTAAHYHIPEFRQVWERFDLKGKRVLEVGSDFHLASARLFHANGAAEVVATNLGHWVSDEPLPEGVRFVCGDVADVADRELAPGSFDIVYGIAVLEHIPALDRVARAVARLLAPGGVAYFQGCPLWPGALGHHVWLSAAALDEGDPSAINGIRKGSDAIYTFADKARNPIPNWAHLSQTPEELRRMLVARDIPAHHAARIIEFVYNQDGKHTGVCSNFRAASEVVAAFGTHLSVLPDPIVFADPSSPHYQAAKVRYSEADLSAVGLRLWATLSQDAGGLAELQPPTVSVVAPFHGVEAVIGACIESVQEQEFGDFELILVDDASTDASRTVAERYAVDDPRIRIVVHDRNLGLGPARNTGAAHARGHYILFLDSDDMLAGPETLGQMVAKARETGAEVIAGSCEKLMPDGRRLAFDRDLDRNLGGKPGESRSGIEAYRGAMCMPGGGYLPMRAWGTLIDSAFYRRLNLPFPAGEHEDLPHTPLLYRFANTVHYMPDICVLYRQRAGGLSRSVWDADKLGRYAQLWTEMRKRLLARTMAEEMPDAAVKFAEHLVWKLDQAGLAPGAEPAFQATLAALMADARGAHNTALARILIISLETPSFLDRDGAARARAALLPALAGPMIARLREGLPHLPATVQRCASAAVSAPAAAPSSAAPAQPPTDVHNARLSFEDNDRIASEIIRAYETMALEEAKTLPAMLTLADRAIYFHAARNFGYRGAIVDAGCFVGGTTRNLVEGLQHNPLFADRRDRSQGLIRVYDLFAINDDYIRDHLQRNYPGTDFSGQASFLPFFQRNLQPYADLLDVRPGDVTSIGYSDELPIEVLGVDLCKALSVTDFTVRAFFPRLLPDALVLQQDYIHEFHPYIHLSMLRLSPHFKTEVEFRWGGTVAFRLTRPISHSDLHHAFGSDNRWYGDVATNTALLRRLIEEAQYDENRWIYYLTLAVYLAHAGCRADAREVFAEASERFPRFKPSDNTRKIVNGCGMP